MKPLASTGLPPHFSTTLDKSTPAYISNHAVMVLVIVDGKKTAIPIDAPRVYHFEDSSLQGGTASELAQQVIASLLKMLNLPKVH